MDDPYSPRPIAGWFIIAAVASVLFMGLGCISYLMHVFANPANMPLDQRAAYEAEPAWVTGAYAVAVWVGLIGAVLLVLRRRAAEWLLLVSLLAVLVWLEKMTYRCSDVVMSTNRSYGDLAVSRGGLAPENRECGTLKVP